MDLFVFFPHTLLALGAAVLLVADDQSPRRAGGAGAQVTSHLPVTALALPAAVSLPPSQILERHRIDGSHSEWL